MDSSYVTAFYNSTNPGKVGINEPNPTAELHVEGTIYLKDILILEPRETTPSSPAEGMIYILSYGGSHHIYCYINGDWKQLDN